MHVCLRPPLASVPSAQRAIPPLPFASADQQDDGLLQLLEQASERLCRWLGSAASRPPLPGISLMPAIEPQPFGLGPEQLLAYLDLVIDGAYNPGHPGALAHLDPCRCLDPAAIDAQLALAAHLFDLALRKMRKPPLEPAVKALVAFALALTTNATTVALSFAALVVTLAYPFAKRFVSMPQAVLGVAFSFGIPMAFAAVRGGAGWNLADIAAAVPWQAWALLVSNLFWVLAYDTEYAMVDRDDDLRIGMKTSAITLGRLDVAAVMGFYAAYLVSWGLLGRSLGMGGLFLGGLLAAALQAGWHFTLIRQRTREGCFSAFRMNHWVGFAVFAGAVLELSWG